MKNLKYVFGAAIFALFGAMNVNAATAQSLINDKVAKGSCDDAGKVCNIELQKNAVEDLEISDGQVVTLDLAGFEFTNYSDGTGNRGKLSAIWVLNGGELIIKDSKGTGKVYISGTDNTMPAVNNLQGGKLTIEGGTFEAKQAGGDAIHNSGELKFINGTVKTTVAGAWGLVNEGSATISGGTFDQGSDFSVVLNAKEMTIEDGNFVAKGEGHNAVVSNVGKTPENPAKLAVTGGSFEVEENAKVFTNGTEDNGANGSIAVSGGTYSKAIKDEYLADGFEFTTDEEGNVIVKEEQPQNQEPSNNSSNKKPSKQDDVPKTGMLFGINYTKYLVK